MYNIMYGLMQKIIICYPKPLTHRVFVLTDDQHVITGQENVRLRSHLLEHIKLYFMYNKKILHSVGFTLST